MQSIFFPLLDLATHPGAPSSNGRFFNSYGRFDFTRINVWIIRQLAY